MAWSKFHKAPVGVPHAIYAVSSFKASYLGKTNQQFIAAICFKMKIEKSELTLRGL